MRLRSIEHLENRRPKCKIHTQERPLTRFFVIYNWSTKKTKLNRRFFKTEQNPQFFLTEPKLNRTWKIRSARPYITQATCTVITVVWNVDCWYRWCSRLAIGKHGASMRQDFQRTFVVHRQTRILVCILMSPHLTAVNIGRKYHKVSGINNRNTFIRPDLDMSLGHYAL